MQGCSFFGAGFLNEDEDQAKIFENIARAVGT
jgi:hypothetical protein